MALAEIATYCEKCHGRFTAQPRRTFIGFQRLVCPDLDAPKDPTTAELPNRVRSAFCFSGAVQTLDGFLTRAA